MSKGSTTWNYTYDASGMRTSRSNGTKTYNYVYNGSQLTQMTVGNDTLYFTYGILGPTTVTWNGTTYYYALNAQGDVFGIFDSAGDCVVFYNWDNAWGYNPIPQGYLASTLGTLNPLRYRSYVYDNETGYYYLQSRYYDPEIGRFINADAFTSTGQGLLGDNMFAYCGNNPVCRVDYNGEAWITLAICAVTLVYLGNNLVHSLYNSSKKITGYIYNQKTGPASKLMFGFFPSSHNGCGWIATYNATIMLGRRIDPSKIISEYELTGAVLCGAAGIQPYAVSSFFRRRGYKVAVTTNTSQFDKQAKSNTANVLFYWHKSGAHNIAVRWNGWQFVGYNVFSGDTGPRYLGSSLTAFLKQNRYTGAILTSIS